jgi:hypothetical protein
MTFEDAVAQLTRLGYERHVAEAQVRAQHPEWVRAFPAEPTRDESVLEKAEQVEIRKIAIVYGFKVNVLSQPRATKQTPGIADLYLTHKVLPIALWWESKRQVGGTRTPPQVEFGNDNIRCGVGYGFGDRYAFVEKLLDLELAVRGAGAYGIEPVRHQVRA